MTIPELIANVLESIRRSFYVGRDREFMRDQRALMKAVARYGYECQQRGWSLQVGFIADDLRHLLIAIRTSDADIKYLPIYLEFAVCRHIGQRAEEIQAEAKRVAPKVAKLIKGATMVQAVVERSDTEVLAAVYGDLARTMKARRKAKKAAKERQPSLL